MWLAIFNCDYAERNGCQEKPENNGRNRWKHCANGWQWVVAI